MSNTYQAYFISGVCGVGKSSVLVHLKEILPTDKFDVRDFDERGVPDGGGPAWHNVETLHWLMIAAENAKAGKSTIVCGFENPEDFRKLFKEGEHLTVALILLDASSDILRARLSGRYASPDSVKEINRASGVPLGKFVEDNISFAPKLRAIFEEEGSPIIDTDNKSPDEVAREIVETIINTNSVS